MSGQGISERRPWTPDEEQTLRDLYPDRPTAEVASALNRSVNATYQKALNIGLAKSAVYLDSPAACRLRHGVNIGREHRFQKGNKAWNAGMKGLHIGGKDTQFAPGNMPHNHVPVGTIVPDPDGYLRIKIGEPKQWQWLHRHNWEAMHGEIPKGLVLVFKSSDRRNCDPSNLELITRAELVTRNSFHRYPRELKAAIRVAAKLKRTVEAKHEEQN